MRFRVPHAELDTELSDEGGHPVVQLHGLTSSRAREREIDLDLGRGLSGTRLLRYDARGHGRSTGRPEPGDYRWEVLAADLLALLEEHFPGERVHGAGPSMGSGTLLHAAVADPGRFSSLTLMIPPTAWATRAARAAAYRASAALVEARGVGAFVAAGALAPHPPAAVPPADATPEIPQELLPSVLRGAGDSDLPDPARIAGITVPVRILAWEEDPSHPLATAQALARLLPQAELRVARTRAEVRTWPRLLAEDVAQAEAAARSLR